MVFKLLIFLFVTILIDGKTQSSKSKLKNGKNASKKKTNIPGVKGLTKVGTTAIKAARGSIKSTVDLFAGKHVSLSQITGKWRLSQEIMIRKGVTISCPSTFELLKNGTIVTSFEDKIYMTPYRFKERAWPRYCTIEFEAKSFKGPGDKEPISMLYRGYFKRSIFNSKVILMRGKVYRISGKMFWKSQNKCGKFKATRRRYR